MFFVMVFYAYFPRFYFPRCRLTWNSLCLTISQIYKYRISVLLYLCLFTVPFAMLVAMVLLQWIGVGVCGCPSSCKLSLLILFYFAFRKGTPSSASDADAANFLILWHSVNISPLMCMGSLSCGFHIRKKFTAAQIFASLSDK